MNPNLSARSPYFPRWATKCSNINTCSWRWTWGLPLPARQASTWPHWSHDCFLHTDVCKIQQYHHVSWRKGQFLQLKPVLSRPSSEKTPPIAGSCSLTSHSQSLFVLQCPREYCEDTLISVKQNNHETASRSKSTNSRNFHSQISTLTLNSTPSRFVCLFPDWNLSQLQKICPQYT